MQPVTGYGIGDVRNELSAAYEKNQIHHAFRHNLNAHNQYLQTLLTAGLPALLFLLSSLLLPAIISRKENNVILLVFPVIIGLNFLFESMLCRPAGTVFFAFFAGFLMKFGRGLMAEEPDQPAVEI
jgi:O-antigen ligase